MKEFEFIKLLRPLSLHIGDDAALYADMLVAKDIMVEGVHFLPTEPIIDVVTRLFVSNISDIAAMGGLGRGYAALLGVAIPEYVDKHALADAIIQNAARFGVELIGGDTTSGVAGLFMSMTILGKRNKRILTRSGAKVGDVLYLSRPVGFAKRELELYGRYVSLRMPEMKLGELLGSDERVSACVDISDGLGQDVGHIAESSGVKIVIDGARLLDFGVCADYVVSSGEEYALAFTAADYSGDVYPIGRVEAGRGCWLSMDGTLTDISNSGYEHGN